MTSDQIEEAWAHFAMATVCNRAAMFQPERAAMYRNAKNLTKETILDLMEVLAKTHGLYGCHALKTDEFRHHMGLSNKPTTFFDPSTNEMNSDPSRTTGRGGPLLPPQLAPHGGCSDVERQ